MNENSSQREDELKKEKGEQINKAWISNISCLFLVISNTPP